MKRSLRIRAMKLIWMTACCGSAACQPRMESCPQNCESERSTVLEHEARSVLALAREAVAELGHDDPERREAEQRRLLNLEGGLAIAEAAAHLEVDEESRVRVQRILRTLRAEPRTARECWDAFIGACKRRDTAAFWNMISSRGKQTWIDDTTGMDYAELLRHDNRATAQLCKRRFGLDHATLRRMSYEDVSLVLVKRLLEDDDWLTRISDVELIAWDVEPDTMQMSLKFQDIEDPVTLPWYVEGGAWTIDLNATIRWK